MGKARIEEGSLVKYSHKPDRAHSGLVVKILPKFMRDDNILVMWEDGRQWCVKAEWLELV